MFGSLRWREVYAQIESKWLTAVEHALQHNQSTFAVLPMWKLLTTQSLFDALRARGYRVEEPL